MKKLLNVTKGAAKVFLRHPTTGKLLLRPDAVTEDSPMCIKDGTGDITHIMLVPPGCTGSGEPMYLEED